MEVSFNCTKCGKCCKGTPNSGVRLSDSDSSRLFKAVGPARYHQNVKIRSEAGHSQIKMKDGACSFLNADNSCSVYDARPDQCRSFPFWSGGFVEPGRWKLLNCEGLKVSGEGTP